MSVSPPPSVRSSRKQRAARPSIPAAAVDDAISWAIKIEFNTPDANTRQAFDAWLNASPSHAAAWHRVQSLRDDFAALPPKLALDTLQNAEAERNRTGMTRRQILKLLSLAGGAVAAAWFGREHTPWQRLTADASTSTGERRALTLADGTNLLLNTDTAIDIRLTDSQRLIALKRGEILVATGADAAAAVRRPFWVGTPFGRMQALGTRFAVRLDDSAARVSVSEGAVALHPDAGGPGALARPNESWLLSNTSATRATDQGFDPLAWADGVIVARQMRLADLLTELSRYRHGAISCDEAVANLRVTGVYRTDDIDKTLEFLTQTAPVSVSYRTRFWITVHPA